MKRLSFPVAAIVVGMLLFFIAEPALARSQTLTTTIVITVRPQAQSRLSADDPHVALVEDLAEEQPIAFPYISLQESASEGTYSITDKL